MKELHLKIKVIPNARKTEIVRMMDDGTLKIKIRNSPHHGKANLELLHFIQEVFRVEKSDVIFVAGATSSVKHLKILGKDNKDLKDILAEVNPSSRI